MSNGVAALRWDEVSKEGTANAPEKADAVIAKDLPAGSAATDVAPPSARTPLTSLELAAGLAQLDQAHKDIAHARPGVLLSAQPERADAMVGQLMGLVDASGVPLHYDNLLSDGPRGESQDGDEVAAAEGDVEATPVVNLPPALAAIIRMSDRLDMLDDEIRRSTAERFVASLRERIDPTRMKPAEKVYIAQWTNRLSLWRFFERYVTPVVKAYPDKVERQLRNHAEEIVRLGAGKKGEVNYLNPFTPYGHAFLHVMQAWMPVMRKVCKIFETNTRNGHALKDDFVSIAQMAFLHALEKQAMAVLGCGKEAQGIPFPKRLEFAIRKQIYSELPDLTGPVRIPVENPARRSMPIEVSFDTWNEDSPF